MSVQREIEIAHGRRHKSARLSGNRLFALHQSRYWWLPAVGVYATLRVINAVMFVLASNGSISVDEYSALRGAPFRTAAGTAPDGYLSSVTNWDGQWYWEIAANGYPTNLPLDQDGVVEQNAWAFFPLYPYLVRAIMMLLHTEFPLTATATSTICGALASVVLFRIVARTQSKRSAVLAVVAINTFACAPVFQIAYSESLALLLLLLFIGLIVDKRYGFALLPLTLLAFCRGITAPLAPALLLYLWLLRRRRQLARQDTVGILSAAAFAAALSFAWPLIAALSTGRTDAYLATQKAWHPEVTDPAVLRFIRDQSENFGGTVGATLSALVFALCLVTLLVCGQKQTLMATWTATYVLYMLAVAEWHLNNLRYYLLAFPVLWPLIAEPVMQSGRRLRLFAIILLTTVGLAAQWWYVRYSLTLTAETSHTP